MVGARSSRGQGATPVAGHGASAEDLDAFAVEAVGRYGVPGAAVAVVHGGEPVLVRGYGVREVGTDSPVDADTVFQLASNTKPMTAFTLASLVEEGRIGWDTPVVDVLPELELMDSYATRHLTLRDALAHRSGLPAFTGDLLGYLGYDRDELLRRLRFVPPGSSFREVAAYSNLGYFIAGEVIDRLTGARWEEAMRERLFEPAGMGRSGPAIAELSDDNIAATHAEVDGEMVVVERDLHGVHGAAGAAYSTASDLARWMQLLLDRGAVDGRPLVTPERVGEMFAPSMVSDISFTETPPITPDSGFSYGLGWGVFHTGGHTVLEKGGALAGVRTVVCLVPELGYGIAVVANRNLTFLPEAVRAFALESLLGASHPETQDEIEASEAAITALFAAPPPPGAGLPPTATSDALAGSYENDLYGRFVVRAEAGVLTIEAGPARMTAALAPYSLDTYLLDWGSVTSLPDPTTFVIGPDGTAVAFECESLSRFDRVQD
jgi:CubicO group peptidase (beta-lactamase class C family)